jgi:Spy/CpxP family protein refolding chaperone
MKKITKKAMLIVFIAAFISPLAFSQYGEGMKLKRLESNLNLTDSQKDQIDKLRLDHQKVMVDLKAKLDKARIELREVTSKDEFTRNEFLVTHDKMAKIREEIQLAAANHQMDILDLLNKDQRKTFSQVGNEFKDKKRHLGRMGRFDCNYCKCRLK